MRLEPVAVGHDRLETIEDLASAHFLYAEAVRTNTGVQVELGGARSAAH